MYCVVKYGRGMPEAVMGRDGLPMSRLRAEAVLFTVVWSYDCPAVTLADNQIIATVDVEGYERLVQVELDPEVLK